MICCGFGAIILLLMITKTLEPILLEKSNVNLQGQVMQREQALFEIRGKIKELQRQLQLAEADLTTRLETLEDLTGAWSTPTRGPSSAASWVSMTT